MTLLCVYSRFSVDCLLAAPMVVGAAFLMLKCISSYADCQLEYDSLGIDKCSKIRHRGPCCEEMLTNKQRFLTPGHQGWNDLHSLCRICMEYYLLNNDDNNIIYWIMMIIMMMIIMMTMMIIGTATIMIMIIIITTTLTMTIMKMIMIKTAQTPCQSLYKGIAVFKTKLPGIIDIIETMSC